MADQSMEVRFEAHLAACTEAEKAVTDTLERYAEKLKELDDLIKPPWWRPWAIISGFIAVIVAAAIAVGSAPTRAEFEARRQSTDKEVQKIWGKVSELSSQSARTETEVKNITQTLNKLDSKIDVLLLKQR